MVRPQAGPGTLDPAQIPEPSTAALLAGIGLLAMGAPGVRRMRKRRARAAEGAGEAVA